MAAELDLAEHLHRLEAELVSAEVWASRDALEALMTADFTELGPGGSDDRQALIAAILGEDPGTWRVEDFIVRELTPAVALVTYRSVVDRGPGEAPAVALRWSIWCHEDGRWRMTFHHRTPAR
jgi:hypothetical protein